MTDYFDAGEQMVAGKILLSCHLSRRRERVDEYTGPKPLTHKYQYRSLINPVNSNTSFPRSSASSLSFSTLLDLDTDGVVGFTARYKTCSRSIIPLFINGFIYLSGKISPGISYTIEEKLNYNNRQTN